MNDVDKSLKSEATAGPNARRHVRADAQRNIDSILRTAAESFASSGVDVPIRDIADKAGVGIGTLYRHFPTRSDLIVAVFHKEVDECVTCLQTMAASYAPVDALTRWVASYVDFIVARRGLAAAMNSGDPALENLPAYFQQRLSAGLQDLLDRAANEGEIKGSAKAHELLHGVAMLCVPPSCGEPTDPQRMAGLLVNGLRFGAVKDH